VAVHVAAVQVAAVQCPVVQVPLLFPQLQLDVYCDFEQTPALVQPFWLLWPDIEQVPALVQLLCVE